MTKSGLEIDCDFVVIGAGVHPGASRSPQQAGLETDSGVLTDRYLETSAPGIFAAGDIAEYDSVVHGRRLRIEHWDVAFNQGKYAALNMLGQRAGVRRRALLLVRPRRLGRAWSTSGRRASGTRSGCAAASREGKFTAWYVKDARLAAALTVGPLGRPRGRGAPAEGEDGRRRAARADRGRRTRTSPSWGTLAALSDRAAAIERLDRVREVEARRRAALDRVHAAPAGHDAEAVARRAHVAAGGSSARVAGS